MSLSARFSIVMALVYIFLLPSLAQTKEGSGNANSLIQLDVEKYQLENGLVVLLYEDHSLPMVSYHTWFRVGSKDEEQGYTGIAHLFEHMMFKDTKNRKDGEYDKILQANGGTNNAFTSRDYTGYYQILPSDKLEVMMELESDRMVNLVVDAKNLKSETEVVKEERRLRVDNSVSGSMSELIFSMLFKNHPYGWPVIGWMKDLGRITVEKCLEFYQNFYAPNNAVLVIAGDIDRKKTKKMIEKYYGKLKASKKLKKRQRFTLKEQTQSQFKKIVRDVQNTTYSISYPSAPGNTDDAYVLDLVSNILGLGNSSRLYKKLVYGAQNSTSASSYNYTPKDAGIFQIRVSLKPGKDFKIAEKSVLGEIARLKRSLVKEKELTKAKNQTMKSYVDSLKTLNGKAHSLALNETVFDDYGLLFRDLSRYSAVTPKDIKRVMNTYFKKEKANTVIVVPRASK